jgi:leucyl aminopeptidase
MLFNAALLALATSAQLVASAPVANGDVIVPVDKGLRLIKTSPEDPGQWVTDGQKDEMAASGQHFIDITDITDESVLSILSTPDGAEARLAAAVTYPTSLSHQSVANPLVNAATTSGPQSWLQTLTNYNNRHYRSTTGTQSGTWLLSQVRSIAAANPNIVVSTFTHSYNQPSIIARIPGASSDLVIVGAHYDSISSGGTNARAPGADDNGSGSVTILEALRVLANARFTPENTLEFHWYSGEEGGLLGSADVFRSYRTQAKNVLAFVNQDMTGYSPSGRISIYTDYADAGLTAYCRVVAQGYTGVSTTSDACGYGCSDHASARSNGFPAAYVNEDTMAASSPYIHTSSDAYSTIMWPAILRHAKFTIGFLVEASFL